MKGENILAVTACLKRCSIAVVYEDSLYEINEDVDAAENLVLLADNLIKANGIDRIDKIITTSGPGSFTGIRTAQSFVKALAFAKKIPAFSVDYFEVLDDLSADLPDLRKTIVIKSDKNQAYFCKIRSGKREENAGVASYADIAKNIDENECIVGDAISEICEYTSVACYKYIDDFRQAKYLLRFSDDDRKSSIISPLYINASSAQRPIKPATASF